MGRYLNLFRLFCSISFFGISTLLCGENKPVVVSSASIFNDMVNNIAGDLVDAHSIVPIGGDPHRYEATPEDAKLISRADLILINGLTFEGWINEVIDNSGGNARTVTITTGIQPIASTQHQNAVDPHAWMDAENGLIYIRNIKEALVAIDPTHASTYEKNYAAYKAKLEDLHQFIAKKINEIPKDQRILITSHDAFSYFGRKYGMTINAMMGVSTEADAQTVDLKRIIESIKAHHVKAIFIESTINPKLLQQVAKDQHVIIGGNLYADSVGEQGTEGDTYIGMLKHNAETISTALSGKNIEYEGHGQKGISLWLYFFLIVIMLSSWIVLYYKIKK